MARCVVDNDFYCVMCGKPGIPIARIVGKEREAGHLKKIYCLYCGKETNHAECRLGTKYNVADFRLEFEHGNFDEQGNRKIPYNKFKQEMRNAEQI